MLGMVTGPNCCSAEFFPCYIGTLFKGFIIYLDIIKTESGHYLIILVKNTL